MKTGRGRFKVSGLPLSAAAFFLTRLPLPEKVVVLVPDKATAERWQRALSFFGAEDVFLFPAPEAPPFASVYPEPEISARRVATLFRLLEPGRALVVATPEAVMQRTLPPEVLKNHYEYLLVGEEVPREALFKKLLLLGYEKTGLVQRPGEFAVRGGVVDLFGPYFEDPARVDFFGDLIESLKLFDPETQRSKRRVEEAVILPVREILLPEDKSELEERLLSRAREYRLPSEKREAYLKALETGDILDPEPFWLPLVYQSPASLFDYLTGEILLVLFEPEAILEAARLFAKKVGLGSRCARESKRLLVEEEESFLPEEEFSAHLKRLAFALSLRSLPLSGEDMSFEVSDHRFHVEGIRAKPKEALNLGLGLLSEKLEAGEHVVVVTPQERGAEYLKNTFLRRFSLQEVPIRTAPFTEPDLKAPLEIYVGDLPQGFFWPGFGLFVIPEHELFGTRRPVAVRHRKTARDTFLRFEDLKPGDYVVHREHGIGLYRGLVSLELGGLPGEFLLIEYQGGDKLYLPVDRLSLLHKYVGIEGKAPKLDRLGGKSFEARKQKVKKAIQEVAQELLTLYAARKVKSGFAFSPPGPLLRQSLNQRDLARPLFLLLHKAGQLLGDGLLHHLFEVRGVYDGRKINLHTIKIEENCWVVNEHSPLAGEGSRGNQRTLEQSEQRCKGWESPS